MLQRFLLIFRLQAFDGNKQNVFLTVKFVMYCSNKIRAKKASIFIEKYVWIAMAEKKRPNC